MISLKTLPSALIFLAKLVGLTLLGATWVLLPSLAIGSLAFAAGLTTWYVSAANSFVFWVLIHVFVLGYNRITRNEVREAVKAYHDEYVNWLTKYHQKTGKTGFHFTLEQVKEELAK